MQPKEIIAKFLSIDSDLINENTLINRQALKSSIFVHRMYGKLSDAGFAVNDYSNINTFGELELVLSGKTNGGAYKIEQIIQPLEQSLNHQNKSSVGIDIENIASLPKTNDFRTEGFYIDNFGEKEIAYCILQKNPYSSFAGLFAAKEAIIKAENKYQNIKFKDILISHDTNGRPSFNEINISISHTDETAVAVAFTETEKKINLIDTRGIINQKGNRAIIILSIASLILSIIAIFNKWIFK